MSLTFTSVLAFFTSLFFFSNTFFINPSSYVNDVDEQGRTEYKVVVKIIGDEWRVVLEDDDSKSDITLRRGDSIKWIIEGSDASVQFPDSRIFGTETSEIKSGFSLDLTVSEDSPSGTFSYTVFVHDSMKYARGQQAPPRIIIR